MSLKSHCLACGNNQTNHTLSWLSQTLAVITLPVQLFLAKSFLAGLASAITDPVLNSFVRFYRTIGVLKVNIDPTKTVNQRGKVLWEEAIRRGIPMHNFFMFGKPVDLYGATVKGKKFYFNGLPRPKRTPKQSEWWADDKYLLKLALQEARVPVSHGASFSEFEPLLKKFHELETPVIIKPRLGSRGRHTTTHITNEDELKKAFICAKQMCYWVVMEEHLIGSVYRGTCINERLAGVLRGDPPRITGDSTHTISELVEIKNKQRHAEVKDVSISQEHINFLGRLGLTINSILPSGKTVDLTEKIGINYGGCAAEVTDITHSEIKKILEKAAEAVGDPIIGFDFIIEQISEDPSKQKWGFIECNGLPFINLHYDPIEGETNNVASPLWDYVEENIKQF
jgi:cyanophycin synthetase